MGISSSSAAVILLAATALCSGAAPARNDPDARTSPQDATPVALGYEIVAEHPHDPDAYTQGLFWHDGHLYEGTGRYGTSWLRKVDPRTGAVLQQVALAPEYFGEGIARHGDRIFQLTWLAKRGFIYDAATFDPLGEFTYGTEGWGLTSDGDHLILSDGSATLFFLDPEDHFVARTVRVTDEGRALDALNELEYIDGQVYANVWHSDVVYRIDPTTGNVIDRIDFSALLAGGRPRDAEGVLNGIAYDPTTGHLFVTGKLWPVMFEIRLLERGNVPGSQ